MILPNKNTGTIQITSPKDPEMLKRSKERRSITAREREHILFPRDSNLFDKNKIYVLLLPC